MLQRQVRHQLAGTFNYFLNPLLRDSNVVLFTDIVGIGTDEKVTIHRGANENSFRYFCRSWEYHSAYYASKPSVKDEILSFARRYAIVFRPRQSRYLIGKKARSVYNVPGCKGFLPEF